MKKIFKAKSVKGHLVFEDQQALNLLVWSLNEKEVNVTISKPTKQRSNQQNKYYRGVCVPIIAEYTGYTHDEAHDALRMLFLCDKTGKLPRIKSTTELSTVAFEEYMTQIRTWASAELSVYIPEPNEIDYGQEQELF